MKQLNKGSITLKYLIWVVVEILGVYGRVIMQRLVIIIVITSSPLVRILRLFYSSPFDLTILYSYYIKMIIYYWFHYISFIIMQQIHGAIFVVDSADKNRLNVAREVLHSVLEHPRIHKKPLLMYYTSIHFYFFILILIHFC